MGSATGGTTTPAGGTTQTVACNKAMTIKATASSGYLFREWTKTKGNGSFANSKSGNTTFTPTSDATITPAFDKEINNIQLIAVTPLSIRDMNPSGGVTIVPEVSLDGNTVNYRAYLGRISSFQVIPSNTSKQWRLVPGSGVTASVSGSGVKTFSVDVRATSGSSGDTETSAPVGDLQSGTPVGGGVASGCMLAQYTDNSAKSETICFKWFGGSDASCSINVDGSATGKDSDKATLSILTAQNAGTPGMATFKTVTINKSNNFKYTLKDIPCHSRVTVEELSGASSASPMKIDNLQGSATIYVRFDKVSAKNITVDCEGNGSTGVTCWLSDTASADVKITADLTMGRTTNYNGNCSYIDYVAAPSVTVTIPKGSKSGSNSVTFHPGPANVNDIRHVDGKASGTGSYALDLSFVSAGLSISSTGGDKFTVNSAWAQKMSDIENNSYYYSSASSCAGTGAEYKNHADFWHSVRQYQSSHLNSKP